MPLSEYEQALAALSAVSRDAVEGVFLAWLADADLSQVSKNVAGETALSAVNFASLLSSFAARLASGDPAERAWIDACRSHRLKGLQIPVAHCPSVLGRAKSLADHAKSVAKASAGSLTPEEAKKHLLKHSGSLDPVGFESFLRAAALGSYIVWATFNSDAPHMDPFNRLPTSRQGICTALGLGGPIFNETLIILVWAHFESGSPPLHRPTIADAECYMYYRPCSDASSRWGFTKPLSPNPTWLEPQPEVVMPETSSRGLRLPFRVISA